MSGPTDGRYIIRSITNSGVPVGAYFGVDDKDPVIVGGQENVWTVKRLGSFYTLALPEGRSRWCIHADENVFVADNIPPQNWAIEGQEGGLYTIVLSTPLVPQRAWTLDRPEPQSLVTLRFLEGRPLPSQLWIFEHVGDE